LSDGGSGFGGHEFGVPIMKVATTGRKDFGALPGEGLSNVCGDNVANGLFRTTESPQVGDVGVVIGRFEVGPVNGRSVKFWRRLRLCRHRRR